MKANKTSIWKSVKAGLGTVLVLVVFAYGFQITKVNLTELRSEQRQVSLQRVIRALARPDIFAYEQEELVSNTPIYLPCPGPDLLAALPAPDTSGPFLVISPACAEPGDTVEVRGFNFYPNAEGPLRFIPGPDPVNPVALGNVIAATDGEGQFTASLTLPERPSSEVQHVRATIRRNIGLPQLTETAHSTWEKIVETVFLALLATTIGTILAIPLSFVAARNLMVGVRSPLASISLSILGWPIGVLLGYLAVNAMARLSAPVASSIPTNLAAIVICPLVSWLALRWALPQEELVAPRPLVRLARGLVLILSVLVGLFGLFQLAALAMNLGSRLDDALGNFGFLGGFLFQVGEILRITTPALGALAAGATVGSMLGRIGQRAAERMSARWVRLLNFLLAPAAGATVLGLLGLLVEVLYQVGRPVYTLWIPVLVGSAVGLALAAFTRPKDTLPTGLVIYSITRTILNATRSVEALVMAIVFVIAVGIGPFAGVLALGLHTIVSLAKLYSEQVESILPGPMEAVEATGANRLQTIIYAVVPQIIPPYISYTMYRWDINVRMSTIIGFVGGGGIGFLLQQNINLLNYRAAAAQMLAIAVVVAAMDYVSSVLRQKVV